MLSPRDIWQSLWPLNFGRRLQLTCQKRRSLADDLNAVHFHRKRGGGVSRLYSLLSLATCHVFCSVTTTSMYIELGTITLHCCIVRLQTEFLCADGLANLLYFYSVLQSIGELIWAAMSRVIVTAYETDLSPGVIPRCLTLGLSSLISKQRGHLKCLDLGRQRPRVMQQHQLALPR